VHFRVWAPSPKTITLVVDGAEHAMVPEPEGYHSAHVATARPHGTTVAISARNTSRFVRFFFTQLLRHQPPPSNQ
jgi:1,4-alpha-glucan branching enzyme